MSHSQSRDDAGKLLLRLTIGGLMLCHGLSKLSHGIGGIAGMVTAHGLPHFVAYGVYIGEVVAPIFVILGYLTRPAAAVIVINLLVAVWLRHTSDLMRLGTSGGYALELQALYALGALAIVFLGAGRHAVSRGDSRWD